MAKECCYQLAKFSHATGQHGNVIPWTKLQANDLFVIICSDSSNFLSFRVVQRTHTLEFLDVHVYIDAAISTRRNANLGFGSAAFNQLPIFGIVKPPNLALRWVLPTQELRRIQMCFLNDTACLDVAETLRRRGMEFRDAPQTDSRSGSARPFSVASNTGSGFGVVSPSHMQPTTPETVPHQFVDIARTTQTSAAPKHRENDVPSHPPLPLKASYLQRPSPAATTNSPVIWHHEQDNPNTSRESGDSRPVTSEFWSQSHVNPRLISQPPCSVDVDTNNLLRRSISNIHSHLHDPTTGTRNGSAQQSMQIGLKPADWQLQNSSTENRYSETYPSAMRSSDDQRSMTAKLSTAVTSALPEAIDLPSWRESEIRKRTASQSSGQHNLNSESSRPGTASLSLPALPRPKLKRDSSSMRPPSSSPTKEGKDDRPVTTYLPEKRTRDEAFGPSSAVSIPVLRPSTASMATSRSSSKHVLTNSSKNENTDSNAPDTIAIHTDPLNTKSDPGEMPSNSTQRPKKQAGRLSGFSRATEPKDSLMSSTAAEKSQQHRSNEYLSLEEIARMDFEMQRTVIDHFFISKLEDEGFKCLCEGVAESWRRFGLGL